MMHCWFCARRFDEKMVARDGIIRGREERRGGPYQLYRCPQCNRESRIERGRRGRPFASPEKEIAAIDYLFSWSELLSPEDFLKLTAWHARNSERRRAFFMHEGDDRYGSPGFAGRIRAWLAALTHRHPPAPAAQQAAGERASEAERRADVIPHPYRILGIEPGASDEEVRRAFREMILRIHPDKLVAMDGVAPRSDSEELAQRRMRELLQAYESLRSRTQDREGA